jgi:tetratricopeptide (TPR) repeat protein
LNQLLKEDILIEARNHFINGNYKMADPLLQQLILQGTRNPEIYQMLATIFYDKGQFSKAVKTFQRALEIDPTYTDASVGLSIILNDLGKYDEGRRVFIEAQSILEKRTNKSDPFVDERLASKHEELGDLYFQYKRYSEAQEQILKALKLSNRKPELTMRLAEVCSQMGQVDRAVKDLKNLVREYPQLITARLKLGLILYNHNRVAEAVEQWENVLVRDSQHPEALRYIKMAQAAGITSIDL